MVIKSFGTPQAETRFFAAYDRVLARWPIQVSGQLETVDLASEFGSTISRSAVQKTRRR